VTPSARPRVVGLGGGHGLAATLTAARHYAGSLTAVVSVADDGGSSGRLRRDFGIPAPGDVRRCLVAMAADPDGAWARAFGARFGGGDVAGHAVGNLVLAALTESTGSFTDAVDEAARLLGVRGRVLPATFEPVILTAWAGGRLLVGQTAIAEAGRTIDTVVLDPPDAASPAEVVEAVAAADQVVVGPGSLFTSVAAVLAVPAIGEALAARRASGAGGVVFVCNLRPSKETCGFDLGDHLAALARHGFVPDVVLADPATLDLDGPTGSGVGRGAPRLVTAALARPDGSAHDSGLLGGALAALV